MLLSGSSVRGILATLYLISITASTALTYVFYSEPVLFAFVVYAVSLLILAYPALCLMQISRSYDLEIRSICNFEWIPTASDVEIQKTAPEVGVDEKPSPLDKAFIYAYM